MRVKTAHLIFTTTLIILTIPSIVNTHVIFIPDDYAKIQQGIDAASSGDTIIVKYETYNESLKINKEIMITKYGTQKPIITNPIGATITIENTKAVVSGFDVQTSHPYGTGVLISNSRSAKIENCTLSELFTGICVIQSTVNVERCLLYDNDMGIYISHDGELHNYPSQVINCTLYRNRTGIHALSQSNRSTRVVNSILWGNSYANIVGSPDVTYSCIEDGYAGTGNIDNDPQFANATHGEFHLKWDATHFSPCIDTGDPEMDWDDDGTPADMGAIPVASHDYFKDDYDNEEFDNVDWMSFPVLNRTTTNWMRADSVLIKQGLMDDDQFYNDDILYRVVYQNNEAVWYNQGWQIDLTDDEFDSRQGYKIELKEQYDDIPVKGISGTWLDESTKIGLLTEQENWIGCFLEEPAAFTDAFDSIWDEWSAVYSEHWAVERPEPGTTPCIVDSLTVNPGELYIIEVYEECDLVWNESSPPVPPKTREMTDYFTYTEKIDYMAINIDTVYSDSSIAEIAVFSDDQCIGASKVHNNNYPVQILAYTPETLKNGNNGLEFKLYYEGQKGEPFKSIPFIMYSNENQAYIAKPLYYERKSFATVKLNTNESSFIHTITLLQNYPNPVRTNMTTIRFMPEQNAAHTELNIYNIRGQLVRTIDCDGIISSGSKDVYHSVSWDCRDRYGNDVKNSIYFYKLTSGNKTALHKMLLMK